MKIISEKKHGTKVLVTVEISIGEALASINPSLYYKLGEPMDDVVQAHIIQRAVPVAWCPIEQRWVP